MKVGLNLPATNNRVAFGHNDGVLKAVEKLQKRVTPESIGELQGQLQDVEFTRDFVKSIQGLPEDWRKFIVKCAPDELQEKFKKILKV